jgi:tetratricopeptide (TPR) repeat protein/CHAT domain-containing protein
MRRVVPAVFAACLATPLQAQVSPTFVATLTEKIAAKRWEEAMADLLPLAQDAASTLDTQWVAERLREVGNGLASSGGSASLLRVREAELRVRQSLHAGDHVDVARSQSDLGLCLIELGRPDEAMPCLQAALAARSRLLPDDHQDRATSLSALATCHDYLGQHEEALSLHTQALAMRRRLFPGDHLHLASGLNNVAACLDALDRSAQALPVFEEALAMTRRLFPGDHRYVATAQNNVAACLETLGRYEAALAAHEEALSMRRRLLSPASDLASSLSNSALCLDQLGRHDEALPRHEEALRICAPALPAGHPQTASCRGNLASCLMALGRFTEALPHYEQVLQVHRQALGPQHPHLVVSLNNLASCLDTMGQHARALALFEEALAMAEQVFDGDHSLHAASMKHTADVLCQLGRPEEALPRYEAALATRERLFQGDHYLVAASHDQLALCLLDLGRSGQALQHAEAGLAMVRAVFAGDHGRVATCMSNVALCLDALDRHQEAHEQLAASMAMTRRLFGGDHPDVAAGLGNLGVSLERLGRTDEAKAAYAESLAMWQRLIPGDHEDTALALCHMGSHLRARGERDPAIACLSASVEMIENLRLRARALEGGDLARFFKHLRRSGAYEQLVLLHIDDKNLAEALRCAERGRNRRLLDAINQGPCDPLDIVEQRAVARHDDAARAAVRALRQQITATELEVDRLLHRRIKLAEQQEPDDDRRAALQTELRSALAARKQAARARARLVQDVFSFADPASAQQIQGLLARDELLLFFWTDVERSHLFVVPPAPAAIEAHRIAATSTSLTKAVDAWNEHISRGKLTRRGIDVERGGADLHAGRALFESLVPNGIWERLMRCQRIWLVPHGALHRLAFETLVTDATADKPVYWLDAGPAIAYAPSGSVLRWLAERQRTRSDQRMPLDILAVGDAYPPSVARPHSVTPIAATADVGVATAGTRNDDLDRLGPLTPLPGTRREVSAIAAVFADAERVRCLLDVDATEPALFDLAPRARLLHIAGHGVADEIEGHSHSMMVLSVPDRITPDDNGLLQMEDLFTRWRDRLTGCHMVVLSGCKTAVGPHQLDDSPQALPLGLMFAGASSVVSSLWNVADDSTAVLMSEFYRRMQEGRDRLATFTAARKALKQKHPEPFHWGPFLFYGSP